MPIYKFLKAKIIKTISLFALSLFLSHSVSAQPLPCRSFNGVFVPYIFDQTLQDVGVATKTQNGQPIIFINPNVVSPLPEFVRQFWYAHECAHHALLPIQNSEINADCYAIKAIRNMGIVINAQQVGYLLSSISTLPGNLATGHLPGPARAQNLYNCFASP
jgi:hypothetical protein